MKAVIEGGKIVRITEVHGQADLLYLAIVTSEANYQKAKNPNFDYENFIVQNIL